MTLPLMPGSEPVEIKYAAPEPPVPSRIPDVKGYIDGCQCDSCQQVRHRTPRPQGIDPSWIQGRYDFSEVRGGASSLHGAVRWLNPQTGECFDSTGSRQWTFDRLRDGWGSRDGARFRPDTEPASIAPRPVFLWEDVAPMGDSFDLTAISQLVSVPERSGPNVNRLRGRYDPAVGGANVFRDAPRWLDPDAGQLYDSDGQPANRVSFINGQWRTSISGMVWLPD